MMEKMIFGRFIPGDSFVHKMDPRAKLIFVLLSSLLYSWLITFHPILHLLYLLSLLSLYHVFGCTF